MAYLLKCLINQTLGLYELFWLSFDQSLCLASYIRWQSSRCLETIGKLGKPSPSRNFISSSKYVKIEEKTAHIQMP
jgi:hypothetical protein